MVEAQIPQIDVFVDFDGVLVRAPVPLTTAFALIRGNITSPDPDQPNPPFFVESDWRSIISSEWSKFFHGIRPLTENKAEEIKRLRGLCDDSQKCITLSLLTGRERDKHNLTREKLVKAGIMDCFDNHYFNQGTSSTAHKTHQLDLSIKEGHSVVVIDDDLRIGLYVVEELAKRCQNGASAKAYIIKQSVYHPWILRRNGIFDLKNLVFVDSLGKAVDDITKQFSGV